MKAKRNGSQLVYTEQGPGAELPDDPQPKEEPYEYTGSPTEVIHVPAPAEPRKTPACKHGGVIIRGVSVCGYCSPGAFGQALLYIAKRVAYRVKYKTVTADDVAGIAVLALYTNRNKIMRATNPTGLAFTIAERAAKKAWMDKSVNAMPVGKMNFGEADEASAAEKIDSLDLPRVVREIEEDFRRECYERVRELPGIDLLWTDANFHRLQVALDEGKKLLPTKPASAWMIISLRLGLNEELTDDDGNGWDWARIAEQVSLPWNRLSRHQVTYLYERGLGILRDVVVARLLKPME